MFVQGVQTTHHPGGPTPYDLRQNRSIFTVGFALTTFVSVIAGIGLVWLLMHTFSIAGISDRADGFSDTLVDIKALLIEFQLLAEKGEPDGYAPLDGGGFVPDEHLPPDIFSAALFRGCWNAATNTPTIVSSVGTDGEFFIVCTPGATIIDGESEWNFHDIVIFDGDTVLWRRIDGGRNTIVDAVAPASGGEVSLVGDGTGPFFSLLKLEGSGINISSDGEVITFQGGAEVTLDDMGPDRSLIVDGTGPDLEIRQLRGENPLCGSCSGIGIAQTATNLRLSLSTFYRFGTWNGISSTGLTESPISRNEACAFTRRPGNYIRIGNIVHAWVKWSIVFKGGVTSSRFTFSGSILNVFDGMAFPTNNVVLHGTLTPGPLDLTFPVLCTAGEISSLLGYHGSAIINALPNSPEIRIDLSPSVAAIFGNGGFIGSRYELHMFASWQTGAPP